MGPELALVSAGLSLFQGFQGYQAAKASAKSAQQAANYNIAVEQQRASIEKSQLQKQQKLFAATQRTRAASSGATLGSFDDLFSDTKTQSLLDVALLDYDTKLRQNQIAYGGKVEASQYKTQGRNALISGLTGAASSYSSYKSPYTTSGTLSNPAKNSAGQNIGTYRR